MVAMPAEICYPTARVTSDFRLKEAASSNNLRFVPFTQNSQFTSEGTAGVADGRVEVRKKTDYCKLNCAVTSDERSTRRCNR